MKKKRRKQREVVPVDVFTNAKSVLFALFRGVQDTKYMRGGEMMLEWSCTSEEQRVKA